MNPWQDRDSVEVQKALAVKCLLCKAPAGQVCRNWPINDLPLPGRLVHFGRSEQ
jgi:hypothetical protein